jgi:hypothetical protein
LTVDWIRAGLKRTGKTRSGLAKALGRSPSAVTNLLNGHRRLRADEIAIVAEYLGIEPPRLIGGGLPRPPKAPLIGFDGAGATTVSTRTGKPQGGVARTALQGMNYGLTKKQLAETIGLAPEAFYKRERLASAKTQTRLREMTEILIRVSTWAGGPAQAMAWYRAEPIPAFGGRTAESLVKSGQATALRDYLDSIAMGGFA